MAPPVFISSGGVNMSPTVNQYTYSVVPSNGKWGIMMETTSGSSARMIYEKPTEQEAITTAEYIRTCRTRKIVSPLEHKCF